MQELLAIEARHRYLRGLLRGALGESEATETRERSRAIPVRGVHDLT
jgi:hypothetical protein